MWRTHQARIRIDAVNSGIFFESPGGAAPSVTEEEEEEATVGDNLIKGMLNKSYSGDSEEDVSVDLESIDQDSLPMDSSANTEEDPQEMGNSTLSEDASKFNPQWTFSDSVRVPANTPPAVQELATKWNSLSGTFRQGLEKLLANEDFSSVAKYGRVLDSCSSSLSNLQGTTTMSNLTALPNSAFYNKCSLGLSGNGLYAKQTQTRNFGTNTLVLAEKDAPTSTQLDDFAPEALSRPSGHKAAKKLRTVTSYAPSQTFEEYAKEFLKDDTVQKDIIKAKELSKNQHLPLLGAAFQKNKVARILLIADNLLGRRLPRNGKRKEELISVALQECSSRIPPAFVETFNKEVGDIGVLKSPVADCKLEAGELIFLKCNNTTTLFAQCVSEIGFLRGYVIQHNAAREVEVPESLLAWGRLSECRGDDNL